MISVEELKGIAPVAPLTQSSFEFAWAQLPLRTGLWSIATYPGLRQREHAVIAFGDAGKAPLVRIHSECFTGDVVHSQRCDCGEQLEKSIELIQEHGHGFIVYIRDHEGRGIGLTEKIKAYQLQDQGMDTVDANIHLGHEIDARDWSDAIAIIRALGLDELTVLTNNPQKVEALKSAGITVTQKPIVIASNKFNEKYLATKEEKLGHTRGGK
jgi:3,4-dihydroxy 2-butanone 4-phosphate synthase/GTP cyclohydrolase II